MAREQKLQNVLGKIQIDTGPNFTRKNTEKKNTFCETAKAAPPKPSTFNVPNIAFF